jgi:CRP-like cAMP-binding protein
VKKLFQRLTGRVPETGDGAGANDSGFFSTGFDDAGGDNAARVGWSTRAAQVGARAYDRGRGVELFGQIWSDDRHLSHLDDAALERIGSYLEFAQIDANQEVIGQNEQGDYLLVVLEGTLAVDRVQPWGGRARLAEAHAGDMLGEMSLLDAGARFSACTTLTPTIVAVLDAQRLDRMIAEEPRLATALLASLSRRLSLRLRQVSARLSALLSRS